MTTMNQIILLTPPECPKCGGSAVPEVSMDGPSFTVSCKQCGRTLVAFRVLSNTEPEEDLSDEEETFEEVESEEEESEAEDLTEASEQDQEEEENDASDETSTSELDSSQVALIFLGSTLITISILILFSFGS